MGNKFLRFMTWNRSTELHGSCLSTGHVSGLQFMKNWRQSFFKKKLCVYSLGSTWRSRTCRSTLSDYWQRRMALKTAEVGDTACPICASCLCCLIGKDKSYHERHFPWVKAVLPPCALIYCAFKSCLWGAHQPALQQVCLQMEAYFQAKMYGKAVWGQMLVVFYWKWYGEPLLWPGVCSAVISGRCRGLLTIFTCWSPLHVFTLGLRLYPVFLLALFLWINQDVAGYNLAALLERQIFLAGCNQSVTRWPNIWHRV